MKFSILNEYLFIYKSLYKAEKLLQEYRWEKNIKNRELGNCIEVMKTIKTRLDDLMKIDEISESTVYKSKLIKYDIYRYIKN